MPSTRKSLIASLAVTAIVGFMVAATSSAEARHHRRAVRVAAAGPVLVPAHERPGFVHAAGIGLIDLGLGPVFPFGGWPVRL